MARSTALRITFENNGSPFDQRDVFPPGKSIDFIMFTSSVPINGKTVVYRSREPLGRKFGNGVFNEYIWISTTKGPYYNGWTFTSSSSPDENDGFSFSGSYEPDLIGCLCKTYAPLTTGTYGPWLAYSGAHIAYVEVFEAQPHAQAPPVDTTFGYNRPHGFPRPFATFSSVDPAFFVYH